MEKHIHILALAAALTTAAFGQSAESIKPGGLVPGKTSAAAAAANQSSFAPTSDNPSRYAGADLPAYVESLSSVVAIRSRNFDPFGQAQNPDAKPLKPKVIRQAVPKYVPLETATPFVDIIRSIRVTTVMPGEKRFLVNDRSITRGDHFPIQFKDHKPIRVQVINVSSTAIQFRNLDTGEAATLPVDVLPEGMTKGNGKVTAPGMQPNRPDAPLEIEVQGARKNPAVP